MTTRLTPTQVRDRAMTEAELLAAVIDLAHIYGWLAAHFRPCKTGRGWRTPVQGDGVGFPDLILTGRGRVIVAELKRETGRATPEQLAWIAAFDDAGVASFVWRPGDLEAIAKELSQ